MSVYRYKAYNASGALITGAAEADSILMLEARLKAAGSWLVDAHEGGTLSEKTKSSSVKIKRAELIGFFVQMSLLLRAGITVPHALDRLAKDTEGSKIAVVVGTLHESVTVGVPLNQAMAAFPHCFPGETVAIVQAGEVSGKLPEVFESLSSYYEWLDGLIGEIRQALIYPLMVMGASLALVTLLFTFVVPRFVTLLTELQLKIPMITRIVMAISDGMLRFWPVILAVIVGAIVGLKAARKVPKFAKIFDGWLMEIPIFGPLISMFALSRFSHNLGMLYKSGVPLLKSLEICEKLVGNRAIQAAISSVRTGMAEGTPLSKGMAQHEVFPSTMITMISTGETSGTLDFSLQSVSDYYNKIIPRRIKIVFAIFDPAIMLTLIAVVGTVALAVILPILQLWNVR